MAQINEETILKRYESLPDDLKEALMGVSTADAIYEIGRKSNLNVEKIGALAEEVGLIILGFTPSANFISDLKTALGVDEEKASEIANEINQRVFLSIRESLRRLHGASWGEGLLKAPTKFEGQKVAEVKPAQPLREIKPAQPAGLPAQTGVPEIKAPPPTPKEPLLIKPMGVSGAAPRQEIKGITEIPRPVASPTPSISKPPLPPAPPPVTTRPIAPPLTPQVATPEKKLFEIRPPGVPQVKAPAIEIKPPEIKLPIKPPFEIKVETKPTAEIKSAVKLPPPPPPALPTAELKPKTSLQPTPAISLTPKPIAPPPPPPPAIKPIAPPVPPKPPEAGPGYDPYKEPIE